MVVTDLVNGLEELDGASSCCVTDLQLDWDTLLEVDVEFKGFVWSLSWI